MDYQIELLISTLITPDTRRLLFTRPEGFTFSPGQGVELAIDHPDWRDQARPFTPTSVPDDPVLEFTIKGYPAHRGVTQAIHQLRPGAKLQMSEPFGAIQYRGPGVFIAGGAGITPFLAIFRQLARDNALQQQRLFFSNHTQADIICQQELMAYLGQRCEFSITAEQTRDYHHGYIDRSYLDQRLDDFSQPFYLCGPPPFMDAVTEALKALGADPQKLVFEK